MMDGGGDCECGDMSGWGKMRRKEARRGEKDYKKEIYGL